MVCISDMRERKRSMAAPEPKIFNRIMTSHDNRASESLSTPVVRIAAEGKTFSCPSILESNCRTGQP